MQRWKNQSDMHLKSIEIDFVVTEWTVSQSNYHSKFSNLLLKVFFLKKYFH